MVRQIEAFIRNFSKEVKENNAAIFAGAGLSVGAGFVDWKKLLSPITEELGLDVDKEDNLVSIAQYHCNEKLQNRNRLNQLLINEFSRDAELTENHKILARLPITTYWTTNYDKLIEKALEMAHKVPDVKYTINHLATTKPKRDVIVYKMHGDVDHPDQAVLTKDDYESYHIKFAPFITALSGDLVSKTFLFLGFSFTDPNIDYILSRIRATYTNHQREHYCIMKAISKLDKESDAEFEYRQRKQTLFVGDLKRFNITTLLVDEYKQIIEILTRIEHIYKSKTVFVSGSAHEYGVMGRDKAEQFIHDLSKKLISREYKVVSGFGLGVGSAVINGALEEIYMHGKKTTDEQLILRPFPQIQTGVIPLKTLWDGYRKDMIPLAGIAIFLFGNKIQDGAVILANGMEKEFEIAVEKGLRVMPVGATGYVAEKLWKEVADNLDKYYPGYSSEFEKNFRELGDSSLEPDALLESVIKLLDKIIRR
jgi:hypothetical protein